MMSNWARKYGCEQLENESIGQIRRGICYEGSQGQV